MGRRGPSPTPIALRVMRGNPGHRPIPKNTPKPPTGAPAAPVLLSNAAKVEWDRLAPTLGPLLTSWDQAILAGYCVNYTRALACEAVLEEKGVTYEALVILNDEGKPVSVDAAQVVIKKRPEVQIAKDCWTQVRAFARELGFSPAARSAIQAPPGLHESADPMERLLRGG